MRIVDVRHEQTAVFAAEATARLSRTPGLAVLTAGPGVTNGMSAITTAHFNGSPLVVIGGRAPDYRWGSGSLQEIDHPVAAAGDHQAGLDRARDGADRPGGRRGIPDRHRPAPRPGLPRRQPGGAVRHGSGRARPAAGRSRRPPVRRTSPTRPRSPQIAGLLARASRPVLVLGSDVWLDGAARGRSHRRRGTPAAGDRQRPGPRHPARRARPAGFTGPGRLALGEADLVIVAGTPLDFRLGYGEFGGKNGAPPPRSCTSPTRRRSSPRHRELAAAAAGDLTAFFTSSPARPRALARAGQHGPGRPAGDWLAGPAPGRQRAGHGRRRPAAGQRGRAHSPACGSTASWPGSSTTMRW